MLNSKYRNITKKDAFCVMYHEEASKVKCFVMYSNCCLLHVFNFNEVGWLKLCFYLS